MDDLQLIEAIVGRQEAAMEQFYKRYSAAVYAFALKTLKNPVDANETLNEVMLEVWQRAATFERRSSVKTWLLSITHHRAVDRVRRNARHDHVDETHIDEQAPDQLSCSLLDIELASENAGHVRTCLDELKPGHRQVVHLTFFEGFSYPEIAQTLQIPDGTVKTRMLNAKKLLMACLSRFLS